MLRSAVGRSWARGDPLPFGFQVVDHEHEVEGISSSVMQVISALVDDDFDDVIVDLNWVAVRET